MEYFRSCPKCNIKIYYKSKRSFLTGEKNKSTCRSCSLSGEKNPFFGKKHNDLTLEKIRTSNLDNIEKYKNSDFRAKISKLNRGEKNPMFGRSFYQIWVEKYGTDIAIQKLNDFRNNQSIKRSGKNNPMFGRPSPNGSGNGWSGWYNGTFFKSLKELSFMLDLEKNGFKIQSAEKKKFRIEYIDWDGKKRNYYPDFFIEETKSIVECKPTHFFRSKNVLCKKIAAENFCNLNGYKYILIDPEKITDEKILYLYKNGNLKFIDRYELKFQEKFYKQLNEENFKI